MQSTNLGNSDLRISPIAIGGMSLKGGPTKTNIEVLQQAVHAGINFFDTADLYERGMNEDLLGQALAPYRDQVVLATKVGNQWRSDGNSWDWKASKAHIIKNVESSLSRLRTDRIDLYQLHGGTIDDPIDEIIEAFEQLVKAGHIRYYGISSIRPNVIEQYVRKSNIVSVMMQYSLLDRRPESVFPLLERHNISVISRGALTQGILIDKPVVSYLQLTAGEVGHANRSVDKLAAELNIPKMQVLLSYALSGSAVSSIALGIRTLAQLGEMKNILETLRPLCDTERHALEHGLRELGYTDHLI
ncbi:MAG: aldo/keto reductase [Sphingobacterium sp.]|uniref:aldo/keto reductase n=1 Tax=Sphingobacterium sp. JB170 TaxID=1434842 RepID=UPI00097EF5C8|nr:aldo/keto reductase [Sphingobacterium sp. JB170]SJN49430.1 Oxidoreductase, aldo/keto reductase family protein [Sphingobacterium sp. JB170]